MNKIETIKVRDIYKGYIDNGEEGVYAYDGMLNIRPPYQREFVYDDKKQALVIDTIKRGGMLQVLTWVDNGDKPYGLLDGQQRTLSIMGYISGGFSINHQFFHNLTEEEQNQILDYELLIYIFKGSDKEKLEWFDRINVAGVPLTKQEMRNATYTGPWLSAAKLNFSKTNSAIHNIASDYLKGSAIRQDYLETGIKWLSKDNIEKYMSEHQHDPNDLELYTYMSNVITWVKTLFPKYRKEMKGVQWGFLYNDFHTYQYDAKTIEEVVSKLMKDDEIKKKSGIYEYIFRDEEKYLNIRAFSESIKRTVHSDQMGVCVHCGKQFVMSDMEADHIIPWSKGGKTTIDNCQLLCKEDNRKKGNR